MAFRLNPITGMLDLVGMTTVPAGTVSSSSGSSVDNGIVTFDGTTGVVIQNNSTATIDDSGVLTDNGTIDTSLTANRALTSNGSKQLTSSATTATELGYLSGVTSSVQTQLNATEKTANKAQPNGYASLDSSGHVPIAQIPGGVMEYLGVWNASTNSPLLADGTGRNGDFYRVTVPGTQNLGSGPQTFVVGDWVVYNGTVWQLSHGGADSVQSVNGATGTVTVNAINQLTGDVTAGPASGSASAAATNIKASDSFFIYNSGDNTKQSGWDLSAEATGTKSTIKPLITQNQTYQIQPNVDSTANIITQNATSGQIFIGANATIGGANSGIQYSDATTANRGQIKLGSYVNATSVAGVSTLTSRSGAVGTNAAVVAGQDYSKWTAQAGATTPGSAPISGTFAFKANTVNSLTVTSDYHVQLTNLAGTLGDRLYLGSEGALQLPHYTTGVAHFDGSGNITSSAVNLTTDVSGTLPVANGGTNSSTALNNNRVIKSLGGAIVEAAAITANRALISDANGIPTQSVTTSTELGYVSGVTSSIQSQLDAKYSGNTISFQPGGTNTGSQFNTWAAALAAAQSLPGSKILLIDDSITSPAVIPAGSYDLANIVLTGHTINAAQQRASLTISNGVTISNSMGFEGLAIESLSTAVVETVSVGTQEKYMRNCTVISNGSAAIWNYTTSQDPNIGGFGIQLGCKLLTGTAPIFEAQAGVTVPLFLLEFVFFQNDVLSGDPTSTFLIIFGSTSANFNPTQTGYTGSVVQVYIDNANLLNYFPAVSSNWFGSPGSLLTNTALDELASSGINISQPQNEVLASPDGSSGVPSFRSLVAADLPSISSGLTGVLPADNGGSSPVTRTFYVDNQRTDSFTPDGSISRPFATISAAISQVITNADNSTHPYNISVRPGSYNETLTFNSSLLYNLTFNAPDGATFGPGTSAAITSTSNNTQLGTLSFTDFEINGDVNLTGNINGTNFGSVQIIFTNCDFNTYNGGIILTNVNNVYFYGGQIMKVGTGAYTFTNVAFGYIEGQEGLKSGTSLVLVDNPGGNVPAQYTGNYLLTKTTSFYSTATIDAGSELDAIESYFGSTSNVTNNGTIHSFGSNWNGVLVLNNGSTTRLRGDFFNTVPTVNAGATVINQGKLLYTPATSSDWNTVPVQTFAAIDTLATSGIVKSQTANKFLASPNGSSGLPSFRAVVAADIPTLNQNTTGTASNVTGIVAIANGGTGQTTANAGFAALSPLTTAGDIIYENATPVPARLPIGTTGQVLTVVAGLPAWSTTSGSGTVTSVSVVTANGLAGTVANATTTPAITLSTTITGLLKGNGTAISAAVSGTDYQPAGNYITALTGDVTATGPGSSASTIASIQGTTVSGTTGTTNVVFSSAPTLSNPIVGTQTATDNSTKAASTAYVTSAINSAIAGVNPAVAVQAATTSASDTSGLTYNNGVSGIGATLTGTINTPITFDGFTFTTLGQRALVKNDTQSPSGAFNGVYYVTQVQTGILPPILTRALDYDQPSDINNTGAIPVVNGTLNTNTSWLLTSQITTVGTDPLTYIKFSINPTTILTNTLTNTHLFVGNASNIATDVAASGDLTLANTGAFTLNTVNGNVGSFGSSTSIPSITVNAKGLITAASGNSVIAPAGTLSGTTLNATVTASSLTSVGTITSGTWNGTTIAVANGGTGQTSYTDGQLLIGNSSGNTLTKSTLTAGSGISITNGNGSISISETVPSSVGDIAETSFTAADNQVAAANVTGLAFANGTVRSADILLSIVRNTTYAQYKINVVQAAASWYINQSYVGDDAGLVFTITTAGQIQYVSSSTGFTALLKFRAISSSV